jgi:hypothetical protein
MGDTTLALAHWNALRALHIADGKGVEEGARALLDLGHGAAAAAWVQAYLQTQDDTTASESLQQILRTAQGVTGPAAKSP